METEVFRSNSLSECRLFSSIRQTLLPPISKKQVKKFEKEMKRDQDFWFETTSSLTGIKHRWSYDRSIQSFKCVRTQDEDMENLKFEYIEWDKEVS